MRPIAMTAGAVMIAALIVGSIAWASSGTAESGIAFEQDAYPLGKLLVFPEFLETILGKPGLVVIDARTEGYAAGHIPGAVSMSWKDFADSEFNLKPLADLERLLGRKGLGRAMTFVVYDDPKSSRGSAGRIFWMLEYLGCKDVHLLNGGWSLWKASQRPSEKDPVRLPATTFIAEVNESLLTTTVPIAGRLGKADFRLIDARTDEEYNGWTLYNEPRGGHIPGAVQIPFEWFFNPDGTLIDHEKLNSLFEKRDVTRDQEIAVYSTRGVRSGLTYFALRLLGYPRVSNYDGSIHAWSLDPHLDMDRLAHYDRFVSAAWVRELVEGRNPPTYSGNGYVILEARYVKSTTTGAIADPSTIGYIPGAISIHPCYLEHENNTAKYYPIYSEPADGNLLPSERLKQALGSLGITSKTTVVVYGSGVIIPMTSARVAWGLMYAGVDDVRILNGGYPAWLSMGCPTVSEPTTPKAKDFGDTVPGHPEFLATMAYVRDIVSGVHTGSVMVDVRKQEENLGSLNPYPFFTAKGKIPGAAWMGDWTELVDMNDSTFRCYTEVRSIWDGLGINPALEPIFYCGTGWRSSIGFYMAQAMGFPKVRNYDGSFYEWSWYPENATRD
ncbi:MAG: rhodanese-like domain-containing protein [Pseudomonadota bacterium]